MTQDPGKTLQVFKFIGTVNCNCLKFDKATI